MRVETFDLAIFYNDMNNKRFMRRTKRFYRISRVAAEYYKNYYIETYKDVNYNMCKSKKQW